LGRNLAKAKYADRKSSTVSSPLMGEEKGEAEIVTRKFTPPLYPLQQGEGI
jgi:hypothetical protein